jgi:hypothetical protein
MKQRNVSIGVQHANSIFLGIEFIFKGPSSLELLNNHSTFGIACRGRVAFHRRIIIVFDEKAVAGDSLRSGLESLTTWDALTESWEEGTKCQL